MAVVIFKLHNVPEDEAQDIRELLDDHNFEYYETPAGNWGFSMPALWLHDKTQKQQAKALIDAYQDQRLVDAKLAHRELKERGEHATLWTEFLSNPIKFIFMIGVISALIYFSIVPWFNY